jgi:excisionase family DNA binding protein
MSADEMLGPKEAAAMLGISTDTLHRWGDAGRIRYTRLPTGRRKYRREDLKGLLTVVNDPEDIDPEGETCGHAFRIDGPFRAELAEYVETLTLPAELAAEFQQAWNASIIKLPDSLSAEEYWAAVITRGQRLTDAYERIWAGRSGSPVLTNLLIDAMAAIRGRVEDAETNLRELTGESKHPRTVVQLRGSVLGSQEGGSK